jgi:regulatory protein
MAPADRRDAAYNAAIRLLAARERSALELRTRLAQKGFDRETVIATIDRLQASGLQDDARFAEAFAASATVRNVSSGLIRRQLREKGVGVEVAAQASVADPAEEESRARAAAARRAQALGRMPPAAARNRLAAYLVRRGYPAELAETVSREQFGEPGD